MGTPSSLRRVVVDNRSAFWCFGLFGVSATSRSHFPLFLKILTRLRIITNDMVLTDDIRLIQDLHGLTYDWWWRRSGEEDRTDKGFALSGIIVGLAMAWHSRRFNAFLFDLASHNCTPFILLPLQR